MSRLLCLLAFLMLPLVAAVTAAPERDVSPLVVNVGGEVNRPGPVKYRNDISLLAVIYAAGGPTKFGAMKRVKVIRGGKAIVFDLTSKKGKVELSKPADTIEVPKKNLFGR